MKYVVIQSGGKQYRASEGDILELEHLDGEKDQKVIFDEVLLFTNNGTVTVGTPLVSGISVEGVILENFKGEKIRVAKFKAKSRYRRVIGHRQSLSKVRIDSISEKLNKKPAITKITEKHRNSDSHKG